MNDHTSKKRKPRITFADYFKRNTDIRETLAELGAALLIQPCQLPHRCIDEQVLPELQERLKRGQMLVGMNSERAKREFLIAPILLEAAAQSQARINVEYPLDIDERLKGTLDYLVRGAGTLLVVEAKNADLERGFVQLAVELIALDKWGKPLPDILYGAVSVGDAWRFGFLHRESQTITQDTRLYAIPHELQELLEILTAILKNEHA